MINKKYVGLVAGAMFLASAGLASAAVNLTHLVVDGATNATVGEGDSVEAKVTYVITTDTDVESMSWELVGSDLPQQCVNVTDRIANGTFTASFDMDTNGASEGTWDVRIRTYGDDGGDVSNLCETTDQSDSMLFSDRITITDDEDDNQDNIGGSDGNNQDDEDDERFNDLEDSLDDLAKLVAALVAKINTPPVVPPPPAVPAACTTLQTKLVGTVPNTYNPANATLQGFLISEGMSIPALTQGASWGYLGSQTQTALSMFRSSRGCF